LNDLNTRQSIIVSQESLSELKKQSALFDQSTYKLDQRDKALYKMIGDALRKKDSLRANMFANELTRVRHLKRVMSQSQLILDCMTIRMENLIDLYNAIQLEPISQVIKEVVGDIQSVSPEFVAGLEQLTRLASDTLKQTTIGFNQPALDEIFSAKNPESVEILREVSKTIESCLQESFPEPPIKEAPVTAAPPLEAIAYGLESVVQPTFSPKKASITDSNDWDILSDDVVKILDSFNSKERMKTGSSTP